jgi:multidrug transporter EmrE-like cation transporter
MLIYFILAASTAALSPILIKKYTLTHDFRLILLSMLSYLALIYFYYKLLKNTTIGNTYTFLKILSIMIVATVAVLWFKEEFTYLQGIGFVLGLIAIFLLGPLSSKIKI